MTTVVTPVATAMYARVWEAKEDQSGNKKFSLMLLFPAGADLTKLREAERDAIRAKWGDKPPARLKTLFREGSEEFPDDPDFEGATFMNVRANEDRPPEIVDKYGNAITDQTQFYSGCRCRAALGAYAYDVGGSRGVSFGLNAIMKVDDGPRKDGRVAAKKAFSEFIQPSDQQGASAFVQDDDADDDIPF